MRVISPEYKDSTGGNYARLRLFARQAASNRDMWSATVQNVASRVTGDDAEAAVTVAIRRGNSGGAETTTINLRMRREPVHAWLIIPTERWRVTRADNLPNEMTMLGG
jgi:hypothetical protein